MTCADVQTIQPGNGVKTQFSFDFPYIFKSEIQVSFWNVTTKEWDVIAQNDLTYPWQVTDANPTIVEFTSTAPPAPATPSTPAEVSVDNIRIRRVTQIDDIRALFNPGSAIRSDDLNKNFEQLRYAIQEANCQGVPDEVYQYLLDYFWSKFDNTAYSGETWVSDDATLSTTGRIDERFSELKTSGYWDDRYYTETEADARYYTESELDGGQLDNRYYTETELNNGQLDSRYYTETEADAHFQKQYPPLGSAEAPTYTFTGDINTGFYSPDADQVAISTNGQGRLFVDADGNVGIGAPSSITGLELSSNIQIKYAGVNTDPGGSRYLIFNNTDPTLVSDQPLGGISWVNNDMPATAGEAAFVKAYSAGNTGAAYLTLGTGSQNAATERLRITSAGLVGIGTSTVNSLLDLKTSANINQSVIEAGTDNGNQIFKLASGGSGAAYMQLKDQTGIVKVAFSTTASSYFTGGSLGIGTATPGSYSLSADNLVIVGTQNEGISIISGTNNAGNIWFGDADAQGQGRIAYSHLIDQLAFATGGTERLYIASTGAIGVGGGVGGANYGTAGQILTSSGSAAAPTWTSPSGTRNHIINGDFSVAQRGTSFGSSSNYDDFYTLDRWYILCDGINDVIDVTQETSTVPTNQKYAIALDVETVNKKFGIAQIIENVNCVGLTGGNVTLSFKAKVSSTTKLDNVKAAIVAWSGTADTVTSDIISAWGAEGTNPTLIANATYENTPANLNVTTSYASYSLSANIDTASTSNIIVFIWSDVTDTTAGDFLYITDVQLEPGTLATPFERRSYGQELALCERYFQIGRATLNGFGSTGGVVGSPQNYRTTMRTPAAVGLASFENINFSLITESNSQPGGFRLHGAIAPGTNINAYYAADYFANAEL